MKITHKQLKEMVKEAIDTVLNKDIVKYQYFLSLYHTNDFLALDCIFLFGTIKNVFICYEDCYQHPLPQSNPPHGHGQRPLPHPSESIIRCPSPGRSSS